MEGGSRSAVITALIVVLSALWVAGFGAASSAAERLDLPDHAPIQIVGDENFTAANGVTGGSGTPDDPFLIEGWHILDDSWAIPQAVLVQNTTANFALRGLIINVTASDPEIGSPPAIRLTNVSHAVVRNVSVSGGSSIVRVANSAFVSVTENSIVKADGLAAVAIIAVGASRFIQVESNVLPGGAGGVGAASSDEVSIRHNEISNGSQAVYLSSSTRVYVTENNFTGNGVGLYADSVGNSTVFHNNFVANGVQAVNFNPPTPGIRWDSGYPVGGNYWSNYSGVDECQGPSQDNCSGPDGIGDTPFVIGYEGWIGSSNGQDDYPLIQAFGTGAVSPPPSPLSVSISAAPSSGTMPLTVAFTSHIEGGVAPYGYHWTLGDGSLSPAQDPVHIYLTSGDFPVWLDAWDSGSPLQDSQSNVVFVSVAPALVNLSVVPSVAPVAAEASGAFLFSSVVDGGRPPYLYHWDFGDGTTSDLESPRHMYPSAGVYLVTLTVYDADGRSGTTRFSVAVEVGNQSSAPFWAWLTLGFAVGCAVGALLLLVFRNRWRPKRGP